MKLLGKTTLDAEIMNIFAHGIWLLTGERELFLPYEDFPWFRDASIGKIINMEQPTPNHFYWPDLDVDFESIEHPERLPLKAKLQSDRN